MRLFRSVESGNTSLDLVLLFFTNKEGHWRVLVNTSSSGSLNGRVVRYSKTINSVSYQRSMRKSFAD